MDNITQLFIRACKSANPERRVKSVYRRFYNYCKRENKSNEYDKHIANILIDICESHKLLSVSKLATELDPHRFYKSLRIEKLTYCQELIAICTGAIRLAKVNQLEGLTSPLKFRLRTLKNFLTFPQYMIS